MEKQELINALAVIQNEDAVIKGEFVFNRKFSAHYSCNITSITMSYTEEDGWEAIISLQEEPDANEENIPPVKAMTKSKLVEALNMLAEENYKLSANFKYFSIYSGSYSAEMYGVKLVFDSKGNQAILEFREPADAEEQAA